MTTDNQRPATGSAEALSAKEFEAFKAFTNGEDVSWDMQETLIAKGYLKAVDIADNAPTEFGKQALAQASANATEAGGEKPTIVCLCGSTRFSDAYQQANLTETLAGRIVLTIGCDMKADHELFDDKSEDELNEIKVKLDRLHFQKIDLADEVLILNVGGYTGESTKRELAYAKSLGKGVRFLETKELKDGE